MARECTEIQKLEKRIRETAAWLRENAPNCVQESKHLDEGSQERAYWHYGYLVALRDVLRLLTVEEGSANQKAYSADNSSSFPMA